MPSAMVLVYANAARRTTSIRSLPSIHLDSMSWAMKTRSISTQQQHWKFSVLNKDDNTFLHIDEMQKPWSQHFMAPSMKLHTGLW
jgi:hypothetical protein